MSKAFIVALKEELNHIEEINGHSVFFSGVGKINAGIAAAELISRGASEIINLGSCGSTLYNTGEIIKVGRVFQDIDCSPICEYGYTAFQEGDAHIEIDPLSEYSCFTTDYFYDHVQKEKYSSQYLRMINTCSVFDMELFAIARACHWKQIPLTAYKWVSDDGDFSKWQENCEISSQKVIQMLTILNT
jgi:adenosylhomocysteine nucleosidase